MSAAYLLDTNTVSFLLRDHASALSSRFLALAPEAFAVSVVTAGELRYGIQRLGVGRRAAALAQRLEHFLEAIAVVPLPADAALHYAAARAQLEARGTPIGGNDLWIAAHALASDLTLVTHNVREFQRVPGLRVEDWA